MDTGLITGWDFLGNRGNKRSEKSIFSIEESFWLMSRNGRSVLSVARTHPRIPLKSTLSLTLS